MASIRAIINQESLNQNTVGEFGEHYYCLTINQDCACIHSMPLYVFRIDNINPNFIHICKYIGCDHSQHK